MSRIIAAAAALVLTGAAAGSLAEPPDCGVAAVGADVGLDRQRWVESEGARRLVREVGTLPRVSVEVLWGCQRTEVALAAQLRDGSRSYVGVTSLGRAVESSSQVRETAVALKVWPAGGQWGVRLTYVADRREIQSVGAAQGYPEEHRAVIAALGYRHVGARSVAGWQWRAEAWLGGNGGSRVRVDLPQAEPAKLQTGRAVQLDGRIRFMPGGERDGGMYAELSAMRRETGAGQHHALHQDGRLVGSARQPRTKTSVIALVVGHAW